jgi:hypothetical protein
LLGKFVGMLRRQWKEAALWRKALVVVAVGILLWHLVSTVEYIVFMLSTGNAF